MLLWVGTVDLCCVKMAELHYTTSSRRQMDTTAEHCQVPGAPSYRCPRGGGGAVLGSKVARLRQLARMTLANGILCMGASLRESRILSSMSTQRQQSMQKLCSSLHDSSDLDNAHRGIEAPTQKQNISTLCSICHGSEEYINAL